MMAATEADTGEIDVSSYQDLIKVGADCNGAKLAVVDEKYNVRDDSDGSYVFSSGTGEVTSDDPISYMNCNAEFNQVLDSVVDNGAEVQSGEVVVENGGNGQSSAVEENQFVLSVIEKVPNGEVVDLVTTGTVEEPNGMAVEENKNGQVDCEVKVEDLIESESVLNTEVNQESHTTIKTDTNGELGGSLGSVIVPVEDGDKSIMPVEKNNLDSSAESGEIQESIIKSPMVGDLSDGDVKLVEQNNIDSTVELKESRESNVMLLEDGDSFAKSLNPMDQNNLESNADLGESRESVIKSPEGGELSDKSLKPVEQNNLDSTAELGESKNSQNVVLGAVGCELEDVETDVGEGKSKEQSELESVREVEESLESEIRNTRSVDSVSYQVGNEEKLKRMTDFGIDVDVAVELANETDAPVEKGIVCEPDVVENKVSSDKELNESIDGSPRAIELIATPAIDASLPFPAVCVISENKIVKVPVECVGSITAGPDDGPVEEQELAISDNCRSVLMQGNEGANLGNETSKPQDAKTTCNPDLDGNKVAQTEGQCECIDGSQITTEWTGNPKHACSLPSLASCVLSKNEIRDVPDKSCGSFLASPDAGSVSDQGLVVPDNGGSGLVQGHEPENEVQDTDQNKISQNDDLGECIGGCPKSPELNRNPEIDENVISGCIITEGKTGELPVESDGNFQSGSNGGTIVEQEIGSVNSPITVNYATCMINDAKIDMKVENHDSKNIESALFCVADRTKPEIEVDNGLRCMSSSPSNCVSYGTKIEFGSINPAEIFSLSQCNDVVTKSQVSNRDTECVYNQTITNYLDAENHVIGSEAIGSCADIKSESVVQNSSAVSNSDTPSEDAIVLGSEGSNCDTVDGNNLGAENVTKPFQFLVRFPRFDDEKLREQIRDAKLLVDEKTCRREAIRVTIKAKRPYIQALDDKFEAAKSEKRDAMRSVELKRQEIDSVQVVINRVKNAISVQDINNRIYHLEHVIEHETLPLKEEKLVIREIKQLKQLRDELSSNMGSQDEVQQALDQRYHIEGRLKILKKELNGLKDKVSKAVNAVYLSGKKYDEESTKLRELHAQYRAADGIRQEAFEHFRGLKDQLHEKIKYFGRYKDDAKVASDYALSGDKEALHRLCVNQVETVMEQWNKNDEFRKDYVRCNMRSTVRRLKTLDGRSLGPDEESPVLLSYVDETMDRHLSSKFKATSPPLVSTLEQGKPVPLVKGELADGKSMEAAEPKSQTLKSKTIAKPIPGSGSETVSCKVEAVEIKVEEIQQTEEELELARKAEVLRKEEIAVMLKEQRRLEEKAKAQEALERKKRSAEKAQLRAELRAQKEAELKEKEREKRLRKKEKKNIDGETTPALELLSESILKTVTKPKKTVRYTKQIKTIAAIPPALRNRGRKRLKQFMWWAFGALIVLFVFLVGNGGAFGSLKSRRDDMFGYRRL